MGNGVVKYETFENTFHDLGKCYKNNPEEI